MPTVSTTPSTGLAACSSPSWWERAVCCLIEASCGRWGSPRPLGLGSVGAAKLARTAGVTPWAGLAFAVNPGLFFEVIIGGAGVLALATAIWGTYEIQRDRIWRASMWLMLSVLTREVMVVYVAGLALHHLASKRRLPDPTRRSRRRRPRRMGNAPPGQAPPRRSGLELSHHHLAHDRHRPSSPGLAEQRLVGQTRARHGPLLDDHVHRALLPGSWRSPIASGAAVFLALSSCSRRWYGKGFDISRGISPIFTILPMLVPARSRTRAPRRRHRSACDPTTTT